MATVVVFMRVYSRLRITRNIWWDDYFIVLTTVHRQSFLSSRDSSITDICLALQSS